METAALVEISVDWDAGSRGYEPMLAGRLARLVNLALDQQVARLPELLAPASDLTVRTAR